MKKHITFMLVLLILFSITIVAENERGIKLKETENNKGRRWAILIGINDYDDNGILDLKKAKNDAIALGEVLEEQGQFDRVYVLTDDNDYKGNDYPSYFKIKDRLEYISKFLKPEDLVVFSFSGHGVSIDGESRLVVSDSRIKNMEETTISIEEDVVAMFKKAGVKKSLLLIDACRENFQENKGINEEVLKAKKFEKAEVAATFYATRAGWYSYEDDKSDFGAFTRFVIEGLKGSADIEGNSDGIVSFRELASFVEESVFNWALDNDKEQAPYTKIYGESYGDLALSLSDLNYTGPIEEESTEQSLEESAYTFNQEINNIEFNRVEADSSALEIEEEIEENEIRENKVEKSEMSNNHELNYSPKNRELLRRIELAYNAGKYLVAMKIIDDSGVRIESIPQRAVYIYGDSSYNIAENTGETSFYVKARKALYLYLILVDKASENYKRAKYIYNLIDAIIQDENILHDKATDVDGVDRYLQKYPKGRFVQELQQKRKILSQYNKTNNSIVNINKQKTEKKSFFNSLPFMNFGRKKYPLGKTK